MNLLLGAEQTLILLICRGYSELKHFISRVINTNTNWKKKPWNNVSSHYCSIRTYWIMSSAPWKHWQVKVREVDEWIVQVIGSPLPLISVSSLERYPDDLLIWTLSILINSSLWYGMIYGSPSSGPLRLPCLNTTSGEAQGSSGLSKFRYTSLCSR